MPRRKSDTAKIAKDLGVPKQNLMRWVRDGLISVDTEGEGPAKVIKWDDAAVEQARRLRDRVAGDSQLATGIGPEVAAAVELARKAKLVQGKDDVIVSTPDGARIFRTDSTLGDVLKRVRGTVMVMLGHSK
jgi:electron transfer flavoprotein alpha/beta subunit